MSFDLGAAAVSGVIPLAEPVLRGNEWNYVKECLDTNFVSSVGPFVERFERRLASFIGARHAVATVNGTAALHIALLVSGVQPDDEVLVSALSFIAPANAIRYVGAWPVFIDAEPVNWQMDHARVLKFLKTECRWQNSELRNRATGRRVRAILPVHILGHPVDIDPILEVGRQYNLPIIEDASESLGAEYKAKKVGNLGHIACFSFNGNKLITTGGGGMIVTDNESWAKKAKYLSTQAKDDPLEYVHNEIGFNYRLTNIQAALGCAQMESISQYVITKREIASRYSEMLSDVSGISLMKEAQWATSSCWLFTVLVKESDYGVGSRVLLKSLASEKIQARPLWRPLHLNLAHSHCQPCSCPTSENLYRDALSIPCSVSLTLEQQRKVINRIRHYAR